MAQKFFGGQSGIVCDRCGMYLVTGDIKVSPYVTIEVETAEGVEKQHFDSWTCLSAEIARIGEDMVHGRSTVTPYGYRRMILAYARWEAAENFRILPYNDDIASEGGTTVRIHLPHRYDKESKPSVPNETRVSAVYLDSKIPTLTAWLPHDRNTSKEAIEVATRHAKNCGKKIRVLYATHLDEGWSIEAVEV